MKPLIVSINGASGIGTSAVCCRVAIALNIMKINTVVVHLPKPPDVRRFEDDFKLGKYNGVDVILIDIHGYTASAAKRRLHKSMFDEYSVKPDVGVLLNCSFSVFKSRCADENQRKHAAFMIDRYAVMSADFYGVKKRIDINLDKRYGRLCAAGKIKNIVLEAINENAVA